MKTQNKTQVLPLRRANNCWKWIAGAVTMFVLTAWTAHADQLFASINGTTQNGGGSIVQYAPDGTPSTFVSNLDRPRGLAFDKSKNLFAATNKYDVNTDSYQ